MSNAKSVLIYSTLAASVRYEGHEPSGNDILKVTYSILILGGANVADKHFLTPKGVVTPVTPEEFAQLESNDLFNMHVTNGYITHETKQKSVDDVVADMATDDKSAPLTPNDYVLEGKEPPVVAGAVEVKKNLGGRPAKK